MKNPGLSLWLSAANRAAGWWMGHGANAVRCQQRAMLAEMTRAATGTAGRPKRRKPRPAAKGVSKGTAKRTVKRGPR